MKMKNLICIAVIFLSLYSCNMDDCDGYMGKFSPLDYSVYFELLKPDGSSYENNEVKISSQKKLENGMLIPLSSNDDFWYNLTEVVDVYETLETRIFSPECENCSYLGGLMYARGPDECGYRKNENWVREMYYLIEYPDQQIDTLLIIDKLTQGGIRSFEYYYNTSQLEQYSTNGYRYLQLVHQLN